MSNVYSPNAASGPFRGTPAERAAYARGEIQDAIVDDAGTLGGEMSVVSGGGAGGGGFGEGSVSNFDPQSSLQHIPTHDFPLDGHDSRASFADVGLDDPDQKNQPAYLFSLLEDALPKQADVSRQLTPAEQQQRKEQVEHTWEKVRRWLWAHPTEEERRAAAYIRGQADATSLHLMCKLHNPPDDVIQALVEAAPDTVTWTDAHGWLPLHHACANGASPEVLKILIDTYPEGKVQKDDQSRTPLHFYVTRSSDNVASMTANAEMLSDSGAAGLADRGGMLPMHYACAYGTHPAVLKVLAQVYPESLTVQENHGRTPMHLAMVNAHRDASPNTIRFLLSHPDSNGTINTRDKDGFLPLHLLALSLKGYRMDEPEKRFNVSESLSMYLEAEPVPTADFLTAIQDLPDWLQDTAVVSKHVRNVLNDKIARRFPTSFLMLDGYFLMVWIVCFAISSKNHIDLRFDPDETENTSKGALVFVFVASVYFFFRELIQVVSLISLGSFGNWWKDLGNWLDVTLIVLVTYYAVLMATGQSAISDSAFRSGVAFTQGLLWMSIIMFLKNTLVDFAVFVGGVFYVVQRLIAFCLAVGVILLAFAQMFYFIYVHTIMCDPITNATLIEDLGDDFGKECTFPHCTFGLSLLQVYSMMMGEINGVERYSTNLAAQILFVFYAFLVVILLSNVLIAIVTDSYEIIQNDRAAIVFWNNRLNFVAEMDAITYAVQRRFKCCKSAKGEESVVEVKEGPSINDSRHNGTSTNNKTDEETDEHSVDGTGDIFREGWHQVLLLFDSNLYDEVDWIESIVYNIFRVLCVFVVIPLWLIVGAITAGWLWPPQVREYLFVQRETVISRAELERQKLKQLHAIQDSLKKLKVDIKHEMEIDRDEMLRMRTEVETIQSEVLGDLQQVRELMNSLLGE